MMRGGGLRWPLPVTLAWPARGVRSTTHARFWYAAAVLLSGLLLLVASKSVAFFNQGDFPRNVGAMLSAPLDRPYQGSYSASQYPLGFEWQYRDRLTLPEVRRGSSAWLFWLDGLIQRTYSPFFSVFALALPAKIALLYLAHWIAARFVRAVRGGRVLQFAVFAALALSIFAAHNIASLNSFYNEFAFVLFLPLLVAAAVAEAGDGRRRYLLLFLGAVLCGAAKPQFFYIPVLLWGLLWLFDRRAKRPLDRTLTQQLVVAQLVCLLPFVLNQYRDINYYHSKYLGSYLLMTDAERNAIGLSPAQLACIGIDDWGNRFSEDGLLVETGLGHCVVPERQRLPGVLLPYLKVPSLTVRTWNASAPHFTVEYFHLARYWPYLVPVDGSSFGAGEALVRLSQWRAGVISRPVMLAILLIALWPLARSRGRPSSLAPLSVFLSVLVLTQIPISLLGEGLRDLSHHLAGAQYAFDLLLVVLGLRLVERIYSSFRKADHPLHEESGEWPRRAASVLVAHSREKHSMKAIGSA